MSGRCEVQKRNGDRTAFEFGYARQGSKFAGLRAIVGLVGAVFCFGTVAQAADLTTPAGLNPGDKFRFVFLTAGTTSAESVHITDYDDFVQSEAAGATYANVIIDWVAVASTSEVSAQGNVGGFDTDVPVYLVTGVRVASSLKTTSGGFWSGELENAIDVGIDGTSLGATDVWTGSETTGSQAPLLELGNTSVYFGNSGLKNYQWIQDQWTSATTLMPMYAMSPELTAVPESGAIVLAAVGSTVVVLTARRRSVASARPNKVRP